MEYKIIVYLNRIPESYKFFEDFEKARLYHLKHGVKWIPTFKTVSVRGYISTFIARNNRWVLRGVENLIPIDEKFDATMFVFDEAEWLPAKNTPSGDCHLISIRSNVAVPLMCVGTGSVDHSLGIMWVALAHEPMHSYVQQASLENKYVSDVMDTYRENNNPDSLTGNFAEQWGLLQSWIASKTHYTPIVATLTRLYDYGKETVGKLTIESLSFECNTLELGWKENETNTSDIPRGTYQVKWSFMPSHLSYHYQIMNVPKRNGIFIHSANLYTQLLGCLALGRGYDNLNEDFLPDILNSKMTLAKFEQLLNKRDFTLIVK